MRTNSFDQLEDAAELAHRASDLLHRCSKTNMATIDADREKLASKILGMRLSLSLMRRDLTVIARTVNRRNVRRVRIQIARS